MQYPIEVCTETLATVLDDLSTESLSRDDAVAWAQGVLDTHGEVHPGCYSFRGDNNDFCWTWQVVYGANAHDRSHVTESPPPYFFRLHDFAEWAARTRSIDPPPSNADLFPLRPHQCHRIFDDVPQFGIAASFEAFTESIGDSVRSVDDLDFLDEYLLGSTWGIRYLLKSHVGGRTIEGYNVMLPLNADLDSAIAPFLSALGFPMETVHRFR